jgi:hypothetical protein
MLVFWTLCSIYLAIAEKILPLDLFNGGYFLMMQTMFGATSLITTRRPD